MTQYDFIEHFIPNFEEKLLEEFPDYYSQRGNQSFLSLVYFTEKHFEEALQSFMNKVCEEQRKICASDAKLYYTFSSFPTPEKIEEVVKNSTTPNLSDL